MEVASRPFDIPKWDVRASKPDSIPVEWKVSFRSAVNLTMPPAATTGPAMNAQPMEQEEDHMHRKSLVGYGFVLVLGLTLAYACSAAAGEPNRVTVPVIPVIDWGGSNDGPTIPPPTCNGFATCYCFCSYFHRCDQDLGECDPLTDCLNSCDAAYPSHCPYPEGGGVPESPRDCL